MHSANFQLGSLQPTHSENRSDRTVQKDSKVKSLIDRIESGVQNLHLLSKQKTKHKAGPSANVKSASFPSSPGHTMTIVQKFETISRPTGANAIAVQVKTEDIHVEEEKTESEDTGESEIKKSKKIKRALLDIDQSKALADIDQSQTTYVELIKEFVKEEKGFNRTQAYRFLLSPSQEQFRKDFLLAAPWMEFVQEAQKVKTPILVKQMVEIYTNPHSSEEQKKVILEFGQHLVELGIFSKKNMRGLQIALQKENPKLTRLAAKFVSAKPKPLTKAQDIQYRVENPKEGRLVAQFSKLAKGKMKRKERDKFITDFAQDLAIIATNNFKSIHPSELYRQVWSKNWEAAPNISNSTVTINQISGFVVQQILTAEKLKERDRLYSAYVKIAFQLIKEHHDYSSSMAIFLALGKPALQKCVSPKIADSVQELEELMTMLGNYKNLRKEVQNCKDANIPHIPFIAMTLKDFTFMDDGNPNRNEEKMINFGRLEGAASLHETMHQVQNKLEERTDLHYDLYKEIVQGTFMDEDAMYERTDELKKPEKAKK